MSNLLNGLETRQFPDAKTEYMRYQIGRWITANTQVGRFKAVPERVFRLIAWGEDREAALKMLSRIKDGR